MSIYCISDIHGDYEKYIKMLEFINFSDKDVLYVIGDVIDRGNQSIRILQDMMLRDNVIPIIGNHEYMAISCLKFLMNDITEDNIKNIADDIIQGLLEWQNVGGQTTMDEFHKLEREEQQDIIDYLEEFSLYETVRILGNEFVLVHAGLSNFSEDKALEDYQLYEMIFEQPDYNEIYYKNKFLVTGHYPTRAIDNNPKPDYIYKANHHIAIDCGCGYGGQLGAICLDNGKEFYIS